MSIVVLFGSYARGDCMTHEYYGEDLAKYKIERAKEELDTAKVRHASDYDEFYIASKDEALKQIQTAEILISAVSDYIEKE